MFLLHFKANIKTYFVDDVWVWMSLSETLWQTQILCCKWEQIVGRWGITSGIYNLKRQTWINTDEVSFCISAKKQTNSTCLRMISAHNALQHIAIGMLNMECLQFLFWKLIYVKQHYPAAEWRQHLLQVMEMISMVSQCCCVQHEQRGEWRSCEREGFFLTLRLMKPFLCLCQF